MPTGNELVKLSDLGAAFSIKLDKDFSGLTATNTFSSTDIIPIAVTVNNVTTTYKLTGATLAAALAGIGNYLTTDDLPLALANGGLGGDFTNATNAGFHNSIYRGKSLGTEFTQAQSTAIQNGTFDDLFVGDYWTINGVDWVIVGFDIRYNIGDTALTTHHVGVMPRANLYSTAWNATNDTSTGYVGSAIRANIKSSTNGAAEGAQLKVIAAFGDTHVLSFSELYTTTYSSGQATGYAWTDARTELLSEVDVYGCTVWTGDGYGNGYEVGADKSQLPIFRLCPDFANIRANWWLRSVHSAAEACYITNAGNASYYGTANSVIGVRPLSLIA